MRKLKILSGTSIVLLSFASVGTIVQAGPVRPSLKSVVFKMVGGSQIKPYDLKSEQRKLWKTTSGIGGSSSSNINPDDGQLPSTSGLTTTPSARRISVSSISSDESWDSSSGDKASLKKSPSLSSISSTESSFEKPALTRSLSFSDISSDEEDFETQTSVIITQTSSSSTTIIEGPSTSSGTQPTPTSSYPNRRHGRAGTLKVGESIYRKTYGNRGKEILGAVPRPHLVVEVRENKNDPNYVNVLTLDMSRYQGKEHKVAGNRAYLINQKDPNFSGKNSSFVKLNRVKKFTLQKSEKLSLLGRVVNDDDMKILQERMKFKIKKLM